MKKRPVRLKPIDPAHKWGLVAVVGVSVVLLGTGWYFTIRNQLSENVSKIKVQIDSSIDQAASGIGDANERIKEKQLEMDTILEKVKQGYEEELKDQEEGQVSNQTSENVIQE
jgi:hypothetical protein